MGQPETYYGPSTEPIEYDNVSAYFDMDLKLKGETHQIVFKQKNDYIFTKPNSSSSTTLVDYTPYKLDNLYILNQDDDPTTHSIAIKLPLDQTTITFSLPYTDTTITHTDFIKLDFYGACKTYYATYNEYVIFPIESIRYQFELFNFATNV